MIGRSLIVAAVMVAFSAPAYAFYCPTMVKAIDAALAKVTQLRDQGMAHHNAGDHVAAVKSLGEAARIILNSM